MQFAGVGIDGVCGRGWGLDWPWLDLAICVTSGPWSQPGPALAQFLVGMVREVGRDAQLPHRVWDIGGSWTLGRASSKQDRHK